MTTVQRIFIQPSNKKQIIQFSAKWRAGLTINYTKSVDHRAFMKEFVAELERLEFSDRVGTEDEMNNGKYLKYRARQGEHQNTHSVESVDSDGAVLQVPFRRVANTYETRSAMFLTLEESIELEWEIKAYKGAYISSKYGRYELKVELVCRNGKEVEELIGEKKKKLIKGRWEFRNSLMYIDTVIPDLVDKIPIVKNLDFVKQAFIDHFWHRKLQSEMDYLEGYIYPRLNKIISKYFSEYFVDF